MTPKLLTRLILIGFGAFLAVVLIANLRPYSLTVQSLLAKGIKDTPYLEWAIAPVIVPLSLIVGIGFFLAVQSGEVLPISFPSHHPKAALVRLVSLACFLIDSGLAVIFWPPFSVSIEEMLQAFDWSQINWLNLVICCLTIWGLSIFFRLKGAIGGRYE